MADRLGVAMGDPVEWKSVAKTIDHVRPAAVSGMAIAATGLGIASVVMGCTPLGLTVGPLLGLGAIVLGVVGLVRIGRDPNRWAGKGYAGLGIATGVAGIVVMPVLFMARGDMRRRAPEYNTMCSANITGILKAARVYAEENSGVLPAVAAPATAWSYSTELGVSSGQADAEKAMVAAHGRVPGNPMAGIWLLVARGQVSTRSFMCKRDRYCGPVAAPTLDAAGNWMLTPSTPGQISYSIAYPWDGGKGVGGWWKDTAADAVPLMVDMAPLEGTGKPKRALTADNANGKVMNSGNHDGEGQNVGFADAHTEWTRKPNVGQNGECIWTRGSTPAAPWGTEVLRPGVVPATAGGKGPEYDIIMVPARDLNTGAIR